MWLAVQSKISYRTKTQLAVWENYYNLLHWTLLDHTIMNSKSCKVFMLQMIIEKKSWGELPKLCIAHKWLLRALFHVFVILNTSRTPPWNMWIEEEQLGDFSSGRVKSIYEELLLIETLPHKWSILRWTLNQIRINNVTIRVFFCFPVALYETQVPNYSWKKHNGLLHFNLPADHRHCIWLRVTKEIRRQAYTINRFNYSASL